MESPVALPWLLCNWRGGAKIRERVQRGAREWLGAGLRSYFTSTLVVCNPKLSILQSVYVGAISRQLSPRDQGNAWSDALQD